MGNSHTRQPIHSPSARSKEGSRSTCSLIAGVKHNQLQVYQLRVAVSAVMVATRVRLLGALLLATTVHASLMSADHPTDNCHGDCGNDGVCEGDHFKNKVKELEQQLEARKTSQTADVWGNPLFDAVFMMLLVALGVVAVPAILYCRQRRRKTASTEQQEGQPLMQPNSDTSHKEVTVDAVAEMLFSSPVSHPPTQSDVGVETTSSNAFLNSTATDNGSLALAVQHRNSKEDRNINPDHSGQAGCKQETGREVNLCDVTTRPGTRRVIHSGVLNNPTSEDCKCNRNVVTNVSRHRGDDV